jgi:FKBP-type peptidyl-prolyl cis-trans isomerase
MKLISVIGLLCATALVGCSSGGQAGESGQESASTPPVNSDYTALEKAASAPGRVLIPSGPPPKKVIVRDLAVGHGPVFKPKESFTVNFVAFSYEGSRLEAQRNFSWVLGPGIIKGWAIGLSGMRVGGRRELVIPSKLAYNDGVDRIYIVKLLKT